MTIYINIKNGIGSKDNETFRYMLYTDFPFILFTGQGKENNTFIRYRLEGSTEQLMEMFYKAGQKKIKLSHFEVEQK